MARWQRVRWPRRCGRCGDVIAVGAPVLILEVAGGLARCETCAGPAPPDLPLDIEMEKPPALDMTRLGLLPLEWKRDREPGEDG